MATRGGEGVFQGPDPFAVVGVHVTDEITIVGLGLHVRCKVMDHCFEVNGRSLTEHPYVPTWRQIVEAMAKLTINETTLNDLRVYWRSRGSTQIWDPYCRVGTENVTVCPSPMEPSPTCKLWMHGPLPLLRCNRSLTPCVDIDPPWYY